MQAQEQLRERTELDSMHWSDDPLWLGLANMRIEPAGAALTFATRLARENGWSMSYASAVLEEYRRFLYLAATSPAPVTPSDEVDQAWHLHLAYSRHYWDVLCGEILQRPLHHGPTEGGADESARYRRQYEQTLQLYRVTFASEPPAAIWPSAAVRFFGGWLRVDRTRYWLLPKTLSKWPAIAGAGSLVAACSAVAGGPASVALWAVAFLALLSVPLIAAAAFSSHKGRKKDSGSCGVEGSFSSSDCNDGGTSGCGGGGCGGCGG